MNNHILDRISCVAIFILCTVSMLLLTPSFIHPSLLGGVLLVWSSVAFLRLLFLLRLFQRPSSHDPMHHVNRLLKSFVREQQIRQYLTFSVNLRGPLSILAVSGLIYVLLYLPVWTLEQTAFAFLTGCMFWLIQAPASRAEFAWLFIFLFSTSIAVHLWGGGAEGFRFNDMAMQHHLAALFLIVPMAFTFLFGLLFRRRRKEFPAIGIGVLVLTIYVVLSEQGSMSLYLALWGLMGVCWSQSWPRSRKQDRILA